MVNQCKTAGRSFCLDFCIKNLLGGGSNTCLLIYTKIKNILSKISRNLIADWILWLDGNTMEYPLQCPGKALVYTIKHTTMDTKTQRERERGACTDIQYAYIHHALHTQWSQCPNAVSFHRNGQLAMSFDLFSAFTRSNNSDCRQPHHDNIGRYCRVRVSSE